MTHPKMNTLSSHAMRPSQPSEGKPKVSPSDARLAARCLPFQGVLGCGMRPRPRTIGRPPRRAGRYVLVDSQRPASQRGRQERCCFATPRGQRRHRRPGHKAHGLTLIELLIASTIFLVAIISSIAAVLYQTRLDEHARHLSRAIADAARVMERLRQQNSPGGGCTGLPAWAPPTGFGSWDAWLATPLAAGGGGGKSVEPDPAANELVVFNPPSGTDPLHVTVAVCWRHQGRIVGECVPNGAGMSASPTLNPRGDSTLTESPAMLTTSITCRT